LSVKTHFPSPSRARPGRFLGLTENDYCGGKLGFVVSRLGLVQSGLGLGLVTSVVLLD